MTARPLFDSHERAVDLFQRTVSIGARITAVRSPRKIFDEFTADFPHGISYAGAPVEVAAQDHVSVRATTIAGRHREYRELMGSYYPSHHQRE
jgi:hypothetical protein